MEQLLFSEKILTQKVYEFVHKPRILNEQIRTVIDSNKSADLTNIIDYCIKKAWNDAMMYERMMAGSDVVAHGEDIKGMLIKELTLDNVESINSFFDSWHDALCNNKDHNMKYGIWQKFINMTFKYLYCFKDVMPLRFDWNKCHCPVDSIIAKRMFDIMPQYRISDYDNHLVESIANNGSYGITWNNINPEQYKLFQDLVGDICLKSKIPSKLYFDFICW